MKEEKKTNFKQNHSQFYLNAIHLKIFDAIELVYVQDTNLLRKFQTKISRKFINFLSSKQKSAKIPFKIVVNSLYIRFQCAYSAFQFDETDF